MFKKLLTIFLILTALLLTYLYIQGKDPSTQDTIYNKEEVETTLEKEEKEIIKFDRLPASQNAQYFEEIVIIDNQPMYYAYPLEIEKDNPPELIIYSHGQLQRIINDLNDEYMLKIREYGEFFASKGYIFSASNQHDDNWGQKESLEDIEKSIKWFEENNLPKATNIQLIGFSMGGRTAINYAIKSPNNIEKIALLAPTPRMDLNENEMEKISEIPIKIWHGTQDVNIPFSTSTQYVQIFKNYGKDVEIVPIENAGHFDIETTLMENILDFFEND